MTGARLYIFLLVAFATGCAGELTPLDQPWSHEAPDPSGTVWVDHDEISSVSVGDGAETLGTVIVDDPTQPRTWPTKFGEALISLWHDDALAALSITIDDNNAQDHPWWVSQSRRYGLRFTWFVITGLVGTSDKGGTWSGFVDLFVKGHDIQSHTVTQKAELSLEQEYRDSQQAIEENIPGARALTLAYPGADDDDLAAKYYIGARGSTAKNNAVVDMNYMRTNSVGGKFVLAVDDWAGIPNLITMDADHATSFRGFHCVRFGGLGDETKADAIDGFEYLKANADDLWIGLFREVIQYGKERDAATLEVAQVSASKIVLSLTDTLDDELFDVPLTLKVGLDSSWTRVVATQGGKSVSVKIVAHGGQLFALVSAVPDRGLVELTRL